MGKFKKNIVRPNIFDYNIAVFGSKGVGKTTLAYNVCRKTVGDDYVIFNCGKEDGVKALPDANYYDCPTWEEFSEVIDEIVDERTTDEDYKKLKVVVLDTIDEIFNMAENFVIKLSNRKNPQKKATTINEAFSGFGAGLKKTEELVLDALWRLKSVGISIFVIGHVKNKTMTDVVNDCEYEIITSNLSNRYFDNIANKMDVIGICYVDRDVITEKTHRKDIKGRTIEKNVIANEARKICFRSDDYVADCKSRFPTIASTIDMDSDMFIETIESAIQNLIDNSSMSKKDIEKHYDGVHKEEQKRLADEAENKKRQKELDDTINNIVMFFTDNRDNRDILKPIMKAIKDMGYTSPKEIDNIDDADKIMKLIDED